MITDQATLDGWDGTRSTFLSPRVHLAYPFPPELTIDGFDD